MGARRPDAIRQADEPRLQALPALRGGGGQLRKTDVKVEGACGPNLEIIRAQGGGELLGPPPGV